MDSTLVPIGVSAGPVSQYCDPDEIKAFALAINDPNRLYAEGIATPPTYAVVPVFTAFQSLDAVPREALEGIVGGVHGTHDLYIRKPLEPGTTLATTAERCSVIVSKAGMNVVVRLVSTDPGGATVFEQYWASLMRGPVTGGDRGTPLADHTFPDEARNHPVGTLTFSTTFDQTFRYAGASGDRAVMHVNDEVARGYGFERKFNQGLATLGIASRAFVELGAGGDPRRIRRVAVRFTSPTFPGDDIEVSLYEAGTTAEGFRAYAFEATSAGATVLRHSPAPRPPRGGGLTPLAQNRGTIGWRSTSTPSSGWKVTRLTLGPSLPPSDGEPE
jgi:acyl dehydratase